jgi:hypothetical protein
VTLLLPLAGLAAVIGIALAGRSLAPSAAQLAAGVPHASAAIAVPSRHSLPVPNPPRENGTDGLMGRLPLGPSNDTPVIVKLEKPVAGPALKPGGLERRP